jgi:hypothetical protein
MRRLGQRFDRARWRRQIGVAGAQIDDVDAARDQLPLLLRDRRERILGQGSESTGELRQLSVRFHRVPHPADAEHLHFYLVPG